MAGPASFSPGLGISSQPFSHGPTGNVTGCHLGISGAPTTGTVSAGQVLNEHVTNSATGATDAVGYQESVAPGTGRISSPRQLAAISLPPARMLSILG